MQQTIRKIIGENTYDGMLEENIDVLSGKIAAALQNESQTLTCVYCGHQYPPGTPASNHEALTKHVAECEKHPMFALKEENKRLREALSYTGSALPCSMVDFLGRERYEAIYGPIEEDEEEEES